MISSQAVPPCCDWEQLKLFIFGLTRVSASTVLCWKTVDLDLTITDTCRFSPKEAIMHTLFMKKHLEVGLYASCLFSVP